MKNFLRVGAIFLMVLLLSAPGFSQTTIYHNAIGFDSRGPKMVVVRLDNEVKTKIPFTLIDASNAVAFTGTLGAPMKIEEWVPGKFFYQANFSGFKKTGTYKVAVDINGTKTFSEPFKIDDNALAKLTLPSIVHYYYKQRANTKEELAADARIPLKRADNGERERVDMRGGWADASGDISKMFSHLAYANFMSPQQTPLVAWSLASVNESIPGLLRSLGVKDSIQNEAIYGADYLMRALSKDDYFYMIIFTYFKKDPSGREVVGLLADSKTTPDYQAAFREGGGMAIAALARISTWKKDGEFTSAQYLDGAKRAFAHLLKNNLKYDDDGKENIIDDYGALMAATELWIATGEASYRDHARMRANNLVKRMSPEGYFIANDGSRPFWHASDAGLPVVALTRYLSKETEPAQRTKVLAVIKKALDYNLRVTNDVSNPFGYARQVISLMGGGTKESFFIPHDNETGWWWQGENARLGSLATAAILGGRLVYPSGNTTNFGIKESLASYAVNQLSWVVGSNPYGMSFMYGYGKNVPYMSALYGHGSQKGGISNGITGKEGPGDGSGIDYLEKSKGGNWRWTEQWIPHAAWFLQAIAAMAEEPSTNK